MTYISIDCSYCFLVGRICPLMQAQFLWPLLKRKAFLLRLNKGSNFLQSAFWIWITKRFSLVRELGVLASRLIFQSRLPLLCLAWLFCGVVWIWIFHRFLFFKPSHCMRPNCRAFNELETRHEILKYKSSIITPGEGGGCTPIHYPYGYVPPNGVVILKLLI